MKHNFDIDRIILFKHFVRWNERNIISFRYNCYHAHKNKMSWYKFWLYIQNGHILDCDVHYIPANWGLSHPRLVSIATRWPPYLKVNVYKLMFCLKTSTWIALIILQRLILFYVVNLVIFHKTSFGYVSILRIYIRIYTCI